MSSSISLDYYRKKCFPTAHRLLLERRLLKYFLQITGDVLVIGAGKLNYNKLLPNAASVLSTDLSASSYIDCIADAHDLPFSSSSFDSVVAIEVLEHLNQPKLAITEVFRVLKPGGCFLSSVPFMFHIHGHPQDYNRFTEDGLRLCFSPYRPDVFAYGNRLHVISDLISTSYRFFAPLRIINFFLTLPLLSWTAPDCPSGYIVTVYK